MPSSQSYYEAMLLPIRKDANGKYVDKLSDADLLARVRTCHHKGWFPVLGGTAVMCARCTVIVTDYEVRAFARRHGKRPEEVEPGRQLATKLGAPWG